MMIRREEPNYALGRKFRNSQQAEGRGGAHVLGYEQTTTGPVVRLFLIAGLVSAGDDGESLGRIKEKGHAPLSLFQQRSITKDRTELFGSIIGGNRARQRFQTSTFTSREDYCPAMFLILFAQTFPPSVRHTSPIGELRAV
jgi:hypothetical protein